MKLFTNITMREAVLFCIFLIPCNALKALKEQAGVFVPILNDTLDDDDVNIPPNLNSSSILRYGHHRVSECHDYKKSYVCIMKCLELGYHIAQTNKKCKCVCFKDYVKDKYFPTVRVGWKVPTTSVPSWAEKMLVEDPPKLKTSFEDYGDDEEEEGNNTATTPNDNEIYYDAKDHSKSEEAGTHEAGTHEAGTHEAGSHEAGTHEAGTQEAGTHEEGTHEAGTHEEGTHEAGTHEAGTHEEGTHEAGTHEEGTQEKGTQEEGTHEKGSQEEGTHEKGSQEEGTPEKGSQEEENTEEPPPPNSNEGPERRLEN